uniref:Flavin-dependent thymidylate synthase n=1 Tax=Streptomyces sp. NBC_01393 TaxID=2903851 RepID=A0AAU3IB07_9ACTN
MSLRSGVSAELDGDNIAGSDAKICQAARVSTLGRLAVHTGETSGLINYLMRNRHGSPFEHGSLSFLVEAPIFVAREFMRHRAGWSYNESSGRYSELDPVFYVPSEVRPLVQQGKPGEYEFVEGDWEQYGITRWEHDQAYRIAWSAYRRMLEAGVAKEVARNVLPVGIFTSFYATCNPRSLMHFLSLRTKAENSTFKSFPQVEIAQVAQDMEAQFAEHFPLTYEAFVKNGRVAP